MPSNLKLIRIQTKLDELFDSKIDLSDITNTDERINAFYSRSMAAFSYRDELRYRL